MKYLMLFATLTIAGLSPFSSHADLSREYRNRAVGRWHIAEQARRNEGFNLALKRIVTATGSSIIGNPETKTEVRACGNVNDVSWLRVEVVHVRLANNLICKAEYYGPNDCVTDSRHHKIDCQ